jgi:error-prone DNA polymerase
MHRRDALWQVERAARPAGALFEGLDEFPSQAGNSPLAAMNSQERLVADFRGTGMTIGPHPMAYKRAQMKEAKVRSVAELSHLRNGMNVRIAGAVIARQRPGTANGFVFLSLEDETGITNAIITPQLFKEDYATLVQQHFLLIEGKLQNQEGVVSIKAERVQPLPITRAQTASHDFH